MLEAIKNIQRMEAAIIDKYAERNAWLDELPNYLDDDDLPLEFQDEPVSLEHDDPCDYDIALGSADVACPHTYTPAPSSENAAHAALLAALGL